MKTLAPEVPMRRRTKTYSRGKMIALVIIGLVGGSLFYDYGPRIWPTQDHAESTP